MRYWRTLSSKWPAFPRTKLFDMSRPKLRCVAFFNAPIVALVDAGDPGARSADVIQDCLRDLQSDAEPLQAGGSCAAQIVERPRLEIRQKLVDPAFCPRKSRYRGSFVGRKHEPLSPGEVRQ